MRYAIICLLAITAALSGAAQSNAEIVSYVKNYVASNKAKIKQYEWIETTTTYLKGEQKSQVQKRCYYDVNGKLTKVSMSGPAAKKGGLGAKKAEKKTAEIEEYVKQSMAKVQSYLPPDPAKLQKVYAAGKTSIHVLEPKQKFKVDFADYNLPGDQLTVGIDRNARALTGIAVNTYMAKPEDKVDFNVNYGALPDGTQYPQEITLDAKAKNVKIVIQNSGYKKAGG